MWTPVKKVWFAVQPSDWTVIGLLGLAVVAAAVWLPAVGPTLLALLLLQTGLLVGFLACTYLWTRWDSRFCTQYLRPAVVVTVIFTLYTTLGKLGVAAMPYLLDAPLAQIDRWLFGTDPSLFLQRYLTPGRVEFFSFIYGAFIPYIYLSMALGCLGRPPFERDQFLTGWVFTYAISYLGYLFLPARGPVVHHAADYTVSLAGGYFYQLVLRGVDASGGLQGAFPSLHVGGSLYLCLFDLKTNRLRGLTYLPMVLLIYIATLILRYHYVIDLIVGTAIAVGCLPLGQRVFVAWVRGRRAMGLPALPGGEADVVPHLSGAGAPDAAYLLSAD
jgi:hypothetical protein